MGRRKITIRQITDPKLRHITFNKRKNGLIKKAAELSLLCNVNMLLVFEDGAGNLIQFSKNKINAIGSFFQECKYNNLVELTAKQYPHFFSVNHYKKTKGLDKGSDEEDDSKTNDNLEDYDLTPPENKLEQARIQLKDPKTKDLAIKKGNLQQINPYLSAQLKTENTNFMESERIGYPDALDASSKSRPKSDFRMNAQKPEELSKLPKLSTGEISIKLPPSLPTDMNETNFNPHNSFKKDIYQEEQYRQTDNKGMEYGNAANYMPPNLDPMKRLSGVQDSLSSPFNFYPTNGRMRPFNNFAMGPFGNEEAFSSMLKSFGFPMGGSPAYLGKVHSGSEMDDKLLEAKMFNYLNQTATPLNRQNMFPFSQADFQKMSVNDAIRQGNNTGQPDYLSNHIDEPREDLPAIFKGDPRFDTTNLPSTNLSSRMQRFDGYLNGFDDEYGADNGKQKKLKHN